MINTAAMGNLFRTLESNTTEHSKTDSSTVGVTFLTMMAVSIQGISRQILKMGWESYVIRINHCTSEVFAMINMMAMGSRP